jgi:hypothetical protein
MNLYYSEELVDSRSAPKLEDHPLPAARYWLFNILVANLHIWPAREADNLTAICEPIV